MEITLVPTNKIKVRFRLRNPHEDKVEELSESIKQVGLIHPININTENYLLSGYHRLLSYQKLNIPEIPCIIKESDSRLNELIEIDENLKINTLNYLEQADHIVRREELMEQLGMTYKQGDNRFTTDTEKMTLADIAESSGMSKRSYQFRKQVAKIHPEVKDLLVETEFADNLMELVQLSSLEDDLQMKVCDLLITGKCTSWKNAFYEAKLSDYKLKTSPKVDFNVKERFGEFPKSIMKFDRKNDDLKNIIDLVNHHEELRVGKRPINFGTINLKLHQLNPQQIQFALDYYTRPNDLILDPFNGRGSTAITALYLQRRFIGFEINPTSSERTREVIQKHMDVSQDNWDIHDGCGCEMVDLKDQSEILDGVYTSPPYYGAEKYSDDPKDLCNMNREKFDEKIDEMFANISRLIKRSNYEKKIFYPIMFVLGTKRMGKGGILDMNYIFADIAKKHGLTHWDTQFFEVNNPHLCHSIQRNYEMKIVVKNYESQMVWVKF